MGSFDDSSFVLKEEEEEKHFQRKVLEFQPYERDIGQPLNAAKMGWWTKHKGSELPENVKAFKASY